MDIAKTKPITPMDIAKTKPIASANRPMGRNSDDRTAVIPIDRPSQDEANRLDECPQDEANRPDRSKRNAPSIRLRSWKRPDAKPGFPRAIVGPPETRE